MRSVRFSTIGCPSDYRTSLFPIIAQSLGYQIDWVNPNRSDILILGPFANPNPKRYRWCPRPLRPVVRAIDRLAYQPLFSRKTPPLTLFHSAENVRHDFATADYSISYDLNIASNRHYRLPYWMETIDWSHEGVRGNSNPRYGQLLNLKRLMQPLGSTFMKKQWKAAFLSSHLREPRKTLLEAVQKVVPVSGFGPYFDEKITDHHDSGFLKKNLLTDFALNLCPENGMYPGYCTEKIPEAFVADCLPISWTDENVRVDFNPRAFINLAPMTWCNYSPLSEILNSPNALEEFAAQPLILHSPSILPFQEFVKAILNDALS